MDMYIKVIALSGDEASDDEKVGQALAHLEARDYSIDSVNRPVTALTYDRTQADNGTDYVENVAVIIAKST